MRHVNLNRHLVLETPERIADGAGGYVQTWRPVGEIWGEIVARTGREIAGGAVQLSSATYRITVRAAPVGAPSRPRPEQRLRCAGRVFKIEAVTDRDPAGRYLTCYATEEVAV